MAARPCSPCASSTSVGAAGSPGNMGSTSRGCVVAAVVVVVALGVVVFLLGRASSLVPQARALFGTGDPPVSQGAPSGAVVRVSAPEGEPYRVEWGSGLLPPTETGTIDPELGYRDHPVNPRAVDPTGGFHVTVYAGSGDPYPLGDPGKGVGAVLFASGSYAACEQAEQSVRLDWAPQEEGFDLLGGLRRKAYCGSYMYSIP